MKDALADALRILENAGITPEDLADAALELWVPHPGVETREEARRVFDRELRHALEDPNVGMLIKAAALLEEYRDELPGVSPEEYDSDLAFIVADEVLGLSVAQYVAGYKGMFECIRFDKEKPGVLAELGPFLDDVVAGLVGGVSSNMYSRGPE